VKPPVQVRLVPRGGQRSGVVGVRTTGIRDLYYLLASASWPATLGVLIAGFLTINAIFAALYTEVGGIANARPGSYLDAFFFSVQTLATIGYGSLAPVSLAAHALVTIESFTGLLGIATATGLVFTKFSRPTARVLFSDVATISVRDGVPTLMFRVANERANHIVEAQLKVVMMHDALTQEGERLRKMEDLPLSRSQSPAFVLTWTALSPIVPGHPLHGETPESLAAAQAELVIVFTGFDGTLSQNIHARHSYIASEIRWNHRFVDVIERLPDGRRRIAYERFHLTEPL
jgi:inward rectifier potassium channel